MKKIIAVSIRIFVMSVAIVLAVIFPVFSLKSALFLAFGFGTSLSLLKSSMI
ncbi:hypothetical protein [Herbinix hemicellulosilytica]|uniref:hypothetical protein n=1 Tax=Herbinix hemicellulosilytica TaxID=1564487 RepID=UPI001304BE8E|nr:hypothetical protein [Herbinix hemicellulosilytica]